MNKRTMNRRTSLRDRSLPKSVDEERDTVHWPEPILERFRETLDRLASDGLIYDTGRRKFCPETGRFEIVWAAVPPVDKQN
jgi:hypothetical protein